MEMTTVFARTNMCSSYVHNAQVMSKNACGDIQQWNSCCFFCSMLKQKRGNGVEDKDKDQWLCGIPDAMLEG